MNQTVDVFQTKDYKRSRNAYRMECTFEYFVTLLVAGSFLAKVLESLGMSDSTIGIVSSLISLAFLVQLLSVFVVQRIRNTKRFVILFHTLGQLGFMTIYLVPFMPFAAAYRKVLVVACILFAYFGNYFVTSMLFRWGNSYVHPNKRASFSAGKEMISLASGIVLSWVIGFIMDAFEASGNLEGGFIFAAISIFVFCLCDLVTLLLIKNDLKEAEAVKQAPPLRLVMKNTLGNRNFLTVIVLVILWNIASYTTVGFLGIYNIKDLAFTVGTVQIITACGSAARFAVSKPFGRFSDKYSFAKGIELALCFALLAFAFLVFTARETRWLLIGYTIFHAVCMAGLNANLNNIVYSYVDATYFVEASAIKNSIGGVCGFVTAFLAGKLLGVLQADPVTLFGMTINAQQVLATISVGMIVLALLFTHFIIGKQKVMRQ